MLLYISIFSLKFILLMSFELKNNNIFEIYYNFIKKILIKKNFIYIHL